MKYNLDQDQKKIKKDKKQQNSVNAFDSVNTLYEGRELPFNAFRSGIFPIKTKKKKYILRT